MPKRFPSAAAPVAIASMSRASFLRLMFGAAGAIGGLSMFGTACAPDDDRIPDGGDDDTDAGDDTQGPDAGRSVPDAGNDAHDAGGDHADAGDEPACTTPTATIGANHGHSLVVPIADVEAGAEQTYDIAGSGGHPHFVTLTAAHMSQLAEGRSVTVTSTSGGGHTHSVTVRCDS